MMKKLFSTTCIPICAGLKKTPYLSRFVKDEDGNITIVSIIFIGIIGLLATVSWDLNSHEYHRVKLQQLADRAVLAAADLDQTLPAPELVQDYFNKSGYGDVVSQVRIEEGLNFRTVSVSVDGMIKTSLVGRDYYGETIAGGNARYEADRAAKDRLATADPSDADKTYDDLYQEELDKFRRGTGTMEDAARVAAERIRIRNLSQGELALENEVRAETGLPPISYEHPDRYKTDAKILQEEEDVIHRTKGTHLRMTAFAEAEERVNNVEISMVLDISGSMSWNNKMENLQEAADTFVDAVINPSTQDLVSISVVPYAEHVSAGEDIMAEFNVDRTHNYSHCIDFEQDDFNRTTMGVNGNGWPKQYEQAQHFYWGSTSWNDRSNPVCRYGNHDDIEAFSQDVPELKRKIAGLTPNGNTSIFLGMKWAAGLLDPGFQPRNASLARKGKTDPVFANRPVAFDDRETLKTVILMTDGQNTSSKRINPQVYQNTSHYAHWNSNSFDWWVNRNVRSNERYLWSQSKYWPDYGDSLLSNVCSAAKQNNIVIWSIGFEVTDHSANVMRDCASSPSHFFRVEGVEIKEAFSAIARQINQLRLTQ
jgi:hypothetical protein